MMSELENVQKDLPTVKLKETIEAVDWLEKVLKGLKNGKADGVLEWPEVAAALVNSAPEGFKAVVGVMDIPKEIINTTDAEKILLLQKILPSFFMLLGIFLPDMMQIAKEHSIDLEAKPKKRSPSKKKDAAE